MFLAYYDTLGNFINAVIAKSGGDDFCGIISDHHGNLYLSGDYFFIPKFILGNDTLVTNCEEQFFIAKYATGLPYHVDTTTPIDTPNSIQNVANQSKLLVYPNPNNGTFTIRGNFPASQSMAFELRDVRGATVYKTNLYLANGTLKKEISLKALPPGLYMYTYLTNTGENGSGKLVIQKE